MTSTSQSTDPKTKLSLKFALDLRIVVLLLAAVIVAMFLVWKPWADSTVGDRTIEVTGETTIAATPDEFVFYPTYQFENADKTAALAAMTKKSDEITTELKKLGVDEKDIKTSSNGYASFAPTEKSDESIYSLQLTVTVDNRELAQKVQDYLVSTTPIGSISPQPNFSDAKRKELEATARDEATKDARAKAEQSGKNLGFKVGKVKTVADGTGFNAVPYSMRAESAATDSKSSLSIFPGENELPYSVTVVYYIK